MIYLSSIQYKVNYIVFHKGKDRGARTMALNIAVFDISTSMLLFVVSFVHCHPDNTKMVN